MIEEFELEYLRSLRNRMCSAEPMESYEMRRVGHELDNIVRVAILVPEDESDP